MAQRSEADERYETLAAAARRNPQDINTVIRTGIAAIECRREEDALPILNQAFERGVRHHNLPHTLGLLHRALGDLAPAITWFDRALALAPDVPLTVQARAIAALEAGLPSLSWFERARALAPTNGSVLLGYAAALLAEESAEAADALLDQLLAEHPGWMDGHSALIRLRFAEGHADVHSALDRAMAETPLDPRLHHLKIISLMRAGRAEAATAAAAARWALGETPQTLADTAIVATEQQRLRDADIAFAQLNPLVEADLALNWMRHLLRRGEPERVSALFGHIEGPILEAAWPYLALAWRLTRDPRADWLDRASFIHVVDIDPRALPLADLAALLPSLHRSRSQPIDQSVRGGTQTDGPLLSRVDTPIRALRAILTAEIQRYVAALQPPEAGHPLIGRIPERPRFTGSWSVRLTGGGFHEPHVHGHGWLSSAFYVALPEAPAPQGWLSLGEAPPSLGLASMQQRLIEPRAGRLVLFPSTLWHGTHSFEAGERLSVAFDIS